jgi:hypothetical protein
MDAADALEHRLAEVNSIVGLATSIMGQLCERGIDPENIALALLGAARGSRPTTSTRSSSRTRAPPSESARVPTGWWRRPGAPSRRAARP